MDDWIATQKAYDEADAKAVYYMSMEFLMGRALGNNLINMTAYKEVKEALEEMDIDLNVVEDEEPDAALGNRRTRKTCSMFSGFIVHFELSGIRMWNPLPLWNV